MRWSHRISGGLIVAALSAPPGRALCIYHGQMYAKTTVSQEFADSEWVVRVKVTSADDHWSDEGDSWTIYHLKVVTILKGRPTSSIAMFTYRDSGGFYLDKGVHHDLGGDYLLFLDPISRSDSAPPTPRDAMEVNYSCGQSTIWSSVNPAERQHLSQLSQKN